MNNFFTAKKLTAHTTAIFTKSTEILYLIEGSEKAVLVDTSVGIIGLRDFVEDLTELPITVLITHGHIDHAMGAPEFDTVYMNHADTEIYYNMQSVEARLNYIRGNGANASPDEMVPPAPMNFMPLSDGDSFDLGGIHVDVYAIPGHTPGSMAMLIREERTMITGDGCNLFTFLFDDSCLTLTEYRESLRIFQERTGDLFDRAYLTHRNAEVSRNIVKNVMAVADDVLAGRSDAVPFAFMGRPAFIAKAMNEKFQRIDGGEGNIVYNPQRLV